MRVGDWVEVRSREEILQTLDKDGRVEGMPFMPEMFAFCGQRFQVLKRAHKTCDTVFPTRSRRVEGTVHLETRCDGGAHGGCQAGCLIFWKDAWLKRVGAPEGGTGSSDGANVSSVSRCTEADVWAGTETHGTTGEGKRYICQATQLPYATTALAWWDVRQYIEDYSSGNVAPGRLIKGLIYSIYFNLSQTGIGLGPLMRWCYNRVWYPWRGTIFPRSGGRIAPGTPTPAVTLNLKPGERVRVKPHRNILDTLTRDGANRGMYWDAEMVPYCGGTYRVLRKVDKIVNEKTGRMQELKNPCIILDGVVCQARYSGRRMFCPRSLYPYWREIWLERVDETGSQPPAI
jgi:hypothetical protein